MSRQSFLPRTICLLAWLCFGAASSALAAEFKLPPGKPFATIDIADSWHPEAIARGVQAQSADGAVYLSIEGTSDAAEMGKIIDESDAMLKTRKVELARKSRQDNKFLFNGLPAEELVYAGRDEDGPVKVTFTFVTIRNAVVITYWASVEGDKKHQAETAKLLASLKPLPAPNAGPGATP